MKNYFFSILAIMLLATSINLFAEDSPRLLRLPTGGKTMLLNLTGKGGDKIVHLHLLKGNATLTTVFGKNQDENNEIPVAEGNTVSVECHAVQVNAAAGSEVIGYYHFEDAVVDGQTPSEADVAKAALKLSVAEKAAAYLKAAAASKVAAKAAADAPADTAKVTAAAAAAAAAAKAKIEYEDAKASLDAI
ncbi:MAG: hypothetical protein V4689_12895 [Verrucomicrobiota bacterium]